MIPSDVRSVHISWLQLYFLIGYLQSESDWEGYSSHCSLPFPGTLQNPKCHSNNCRQPVLRTIPYQAFSVNEKLGFGCPHCPRPTWYRRHESPDHGEYRCVALSGMAYPMVLAWCYLNGLLVQKQKSRRMWWIWSCDVLDLLSSWTVCPVVYLVIRNSSFSNSLIRTHVFLAYLRGSI